MSAAATTYRVVRRPVSFMGASGNVVVRNMGDYVPEAPTWPTFRSMLSLKWIEAVKAEDVQVEKQQTAEGSGSDCQVCGVSFGSERGLSIHNARVHK